MNWLMDRLIRVVLGVCLLVLLGGLTACETKLERFRKEGVRLYQEEQLDHSMQVLRRALAHDEFDAVSNAYAGMIHYRADDLQQAAYHFRVALQADPSLEEAKAGLTATLIKQGKPDEALDALERASMLSEKVRDPRWLKSNPKVPYTKQVEERLFLGKTQDRVRIARTYELLGDYDNALVYYKRALERDPKNAHVLMSMANLAEKAGNRVEAREFLRQTYLADPQVPGLTDAMMRNGLAISDVLEGKP